MIVRPASWDEPYHEAWSRKQGCGEGPHHYAVTGGDGYGNGMDHGYTNGNGVCELDLE